MKTAITAAMLSALITLPAAGCGPAPLPTRDPHEGMVEVADGSGEMIWAPLYEDLPVSLHTESDFYLDDSGDVFYSGESYDVKRGIDVSAYQGEIDWDKVRASGIEFAMIRCGYRGYTEGEIYEDSMFRTNVQAALDAGVEVGIYFFSQAVNESEAMKEADYVLELIGGMNITYPVAFDWEYIGSGEVARTDEVEGSLLTDCALAFCEKIRNAGYEPALYFYRKLGYLAYELDRLAGIKFWVGAAGEYPDFYYSHYMWQYSFTGWVDGIDHEVDLNLCFAEKL